jgi:hypothetical protein
LGAEKWDETFEDLKELRDFIDQKTFRDPLQQLQQVSAYSILYVSILHVYAASTVAASGLM